MIDFRSRKKKVLPVTLADGSTLSLRVPTKALYEKMSAISKSAGYDELVELCADILSTNTENRVIEPVEVADTFDLDDISYLIREYGSFVKGVVANPN